MKIPSISSLFKAKSQDAGLTAIGLTAHGVCLAQVAFSGEQIRVLRCDYHQGEISIDELERLKREGNLAKQVCTTLLTQGDYQMLMVEAPNVPENEMKTAIRWKIKDSINCRIDEAAIDVLQIPANKNRSERVQSLYAIVAANDIIQKRMAMFEAAKLDLRVIDIPELAQRNIAALFEQTDRALVLLSFDESGGLLTFTSAGELYLSRRIEINTGQLTDADADLRAQYRDRVELELQRSLDYFDRQFNHLSISRILLSAPDESRLLEFLSSSVGVAVVKLDLSQVMDISATPALADAEYAALLLPALGAALRQEARTL
ncbi:MAG: pilus assembly protein PilM [Gallionella sp.]|jgi:MSHA biogenesis protein MshI